MKHTIEMTQAEAEAALKEQFVERGNVLDEYIVRIDPAPPGVGVGLSPDTIISLIQSVQNIMVVGREGYTPAIQMARAIGMSSAQAKAFVDTLA